MNVEVIMLLGTALDRLAEFVTHPNGGAPHQQQCLRQHAGPARGGAHLQAGLALLVRLQLPPHLPPRPSDLRRPTLTLPRRL